MAVVTTQPGAGVPQQTYAVREWSSGLFACFDDMESCLWGTFCPCIHLCKVSIRMDEGCLYGWCCSEAAPLTLRAKLRTEQHIHGSLCNDAVVGVFCPFCVVCQLDRELKAIGR